MKNLNFFPFERNRYFYGKLLSVDDFETEQRYMNDKRRMLNRFLYGTGVVCGMQVVEVDDFTFSLESGLALDYSGREIVVPEPVTKRLSSVKGFSECSALGEERQNLYLCIAYDERMENPVHSITRVNDEQEEFNKFAEGYKLFVTAEEPEQEGERITALYEDTRTIYAGDEIRIRQRTPKYMRSGTEEEITVLVEKTEPSAPVSFSYQLSLTCMESEGNSAVTVSFDENTFPAAGSYRIKYRIRAKAVENVEGRMEVVRDSFSLTVGQDTKREPVSGSFTIWITGREVQRTIVENYYAAAMEDILKEDKEQPIYLARLEVIRAGDTYVIEGIENLPYKQYVWNNVLSGTMEAFRLRKKPEETQAADRLAGMSGRGVSVNPGMQMRMGSAMIELGIGGLPGQRFYSEEIVHELGLGDVYVSLGLSRGIQENSQVVCGSQNVFTDAGCPKVELAAKVNMARGSFVIGINCLEQVEAKRLRIFWMAVKGEGKPNQEKTAYMSIKPDIANIQIREGQYFEAVIGEEVQKHIKWTVKEAEGGTIDANGYYMAPNQSGVYEIIAESMENTALKAAAFVIVRDIL
ncbi:MAG: hypothetical protein NC300_04155 [Bacteroidales bacterium]|nr:hypothetical protein [Clostridium sp.]MCM1203315.1 hypothetical protein [Bacteroidales bacterium]